MFLIYGYPTALVTLVSDGGSENKGAVLDWIDSLEENLIVKKTARTKEFIFTNNEIESTFNIFKNDTNRCRNYLRRIQNISI